MIESVVLYSTSIAASVVAVGALIRQWRQERHKPAVDVAQVGQAQADEDHLRATIKQMADETNRSRDYRVWQLENYIDLDRKWHREMISLLEKLVEQLRWELAKDGHELPNIEMPPPPDIPEPPHG